MKSVIRRKGGGTTESVAASAKYHVMFIRLPIPIFERLTRQSERLSCNRNILIRMAIVKYLEEEEAKEKQVNNP
jgi:metal-responsive CopG/Arc/MetJ family transcriptional regulator